MRLLTTGAVRRGWWITAGCVVAVVIAAVVVASTRRISYRVNAVLVVAASGGPSNTTDTPPGTLATTYAALVAQDDGVVAAVARATGLPKAVARQGISSVQEPNTSIVDVSYSNAQRHRAVAGAAALVAGIAGPRRTAETIPAGALQVAREPAPPTVDGGSDLVGAALIGLVLGVCLGAAALIAWDRHDPRADDARSVEEQLKVPVTTLDRHVGESTIRAVVERWRSLSDGQRPTTVAVVGSTPRANAAAADVVARLSAVCVADESVVLATSLGSGGVELTAIAADLVVFVTVPGDRLVEARRAARTLSQLGAGPKWAIFAMPE